MTQPLQTSRTRRLLLCYDRTVTPTDRELALASERSHAHPRSIDHPAVKVLIALDESEVSAHAARVAAELFTPCGAEFIVINVTRIPTPWVGGAGYGAVIALAPDPNWFERGPHDATNLMERAEAAGVPEPEALVDVGDPVSIVCDAAHLHGIDIIVVGSHDKSALRRLFDPSVAAGVVRGTDLPVLVVSGDATPG